MNETPDWVDWVGCCHPGFDRRCPDCGWTWTAATDENLDMTLQVGDKISSKGRVLTVTELDLTTLKKMRPYLIDIAAAGTTVTYGDLIDALDLPHVPNGLGRILDLLSEDCIHNRNEPSMAALVVSQSTGEVGDSFNGDPAHERELLYAYWANAS